MLTSCLGRSPLGRHSRPPCDLWRFSSCSVWSGFGLQRSESGCPSTGTLAIYLGLKTNQQHETNGLPQVVVHSSSLLMMSHKTTTKKYFSSILGISDKCLPSKQHFPGYGTMCNIIFSIWTLLSSSPARRLCFCRCLFVNRITHKIMDGRWWKFQVGKSLIRFWWWYVNQDFLIDV